MGGCRVSDLDLPAAGSVAGLVGRAESDDEVAVRGGGATGARGALVVDAGGAVVTVIEKSVSVCEIRSEMNLGDTFAMARPTKAATEAMILMDNMVKVLKLLKIEG